MTDKIKIDQDIGIHGEIEIEKMRDRSVKTPHLKEELKTLKREMFNTGTINNAG